jgi:geranylgeranyl pyrophosphate synthase
MHDVDAIDAAIPAGGAALGFNIEIGCLRASVADLVASCNKEVRPAREWQFLGDSKYFRPLTVFSCYRAAHDGPIPPQIMNAALVVEFFHNVSLIIDDIVDKSPIRCDRASALRRAFGIDDGGLYRCRRVSAFAR